VQTNLLNATDSGFQTAGLILPMLPVLLLGTLPGILLTVLIGLSPLQCFAQESVENKAVNIGTSDYVDQLHQVKTSAWKAARFPLKVWIADGKGVHAYSDSYRQLFIDGLNCWQGAMDGKMSWTLCGTRDKADIICNWLGSLAELDQHAPAFGEYGDTSLGQFGLGDNIEYDQNEIFITTCGPEAALADNVMRILCLHEIGHALGCQGHSPDHADVMYPKVNKANWGGLTERDKATMLKIYAHNPRVLKGTTAK
jgi:hypothetical protein